MVNEGAAINADHLAAGEAGLQPRQCFGVGAIAVGRHQHRAVDDQEIGIAGRQAAAGVVVDRLRQWQRDQLVRLAERLAERGELGGHRPQFLVVRILPVVTGLVDDRRRIGKARDRVDVAVGVVADQVAAVQPQHA